MKEDNTQTFLQIRDLQTELVQYLNIQDILQSYRLISLDATTIINNSEAWAALMQRDFGFNSDLLNSDSETANYLLYRAFHAEQHFDKLNPTHHQALEDIVQFLKNNNASDSPWVTYFEFSTKLHQRIANSIVKVPDLGQLFECAFNTAPGPALERLCWLVANRYSYCERYLVDPMLFNKAPLFKFIKRLEALGQSKQDKKALIYQSRADILYGLHMIDYFERESQDGGEYECEAPDEEYPTQLVFRAVYLQLKEQDLIFYPLVARILFKNGVNIWGPTFSSLRFEPAIEALYDVFKQDDEKLTQEEFLINLYYNLASACKPLKDIICQEIDENQVEKESLFYQSDFGKILTVMKNYPNLFTLTILEKVYHRLKASSHSTSLPKQSEGGAEETAHIKMLLSALSISKAQEELSDSDDDYDEGPYHPSQYDYAYGRRGYDSDEYDDPWSSRASFFNAPYNYYNTQNKMEMMQKALDEMRILESNLKLKKAEEENQAMSFVNNALGLKFIQSYIDNNKAKWSVEESAASSYSRKFNIKLEGVAITKKSDCQWYEARLIKAGIKKQNIEFKTLKVKIGNNFQERYQLCITNMQDVDVSQSARQRHPNPDYQNFLDEMQTQINNIKVAQELLQNEQVRLIRSGNSGCIRAAQNVTKLENITYLIDIFENAKGKANLSDYQSIRKKAYEEAGCLGYEKTETKEDAAKAFYTRTWS